MPPDSGRVVAGTTGAFSMLTAMLRLACPSENSVSLLACAGRLQVSGSIENGPDRSSSDFRGYQFSYKAEVVLDFTAP